MAAPLNFALLGVAGYIAPRHLKAIKDTGNRLLCAGDPCESVGILDRFFPEARFFREFERLDRHVDKLRRKPSEERIQYVSICSPNFLHDAHVRFALRAGAHAICEKPLVINPWNVEPLLELEQEYERRVYTVLQLRLHPALRALRERLQAEPPGTRHEVELTYVTSRGRWYLSTWKGDESRSGGIVTNIGIHFFDLLVWLFGRVEDSVLNVYDPHRAAGELHLERASVRWFLSIDRADLPAPPAPDKPATYRSITMDGQEIEFSDGFTDLHTVVYQDILSGGGFGIADARPSIVLTHALRNSRPVGPTPRSHPFLRR